MTFPMFLTCFLLVVNMSWFVNRRFSGKTLWPIDNSPLLQAALHTGIWFQRWFGWKQKPRRSSVRVGSTKIGIPTSWRTTTGDAVLFDQTSDRNPICRHNLQFFFINQQMPMLANFMQRNCNPRLALVSTEMWYNFFSSNTVVGC